MGEGRRKCPQDVPRAGRELSVEREQTAQKGLPGPFCLTVVPRAGSEYALLILREKDRIHFNPSPLSVEKQAMCHCKVP